MNKIDHQLFMAIMNTNNVLFEEALSNGANPCAINSEYDDVSALMMATNFGQHSMAKRLLEHSADIHAQATGFHHFTALLYAAKNANFPCIKLLVEHGADINQSDSRGFTPLILATQRGAGPDCLNFMIDKGANIETEDRMGDTAMTYAAIRAANDFGVIQAQTLAVHQANINHKNHKGNTPLMVMMERKPNLEAIKCFIDLGADPTIKNDLQDDAFRMAKDHPNKELFDWICVCQEQLKLASHVNESGCEPHDNTFQF